MYLKKVNPHYNHALFNSFVIRNGGQALPEKNIQSQIQIHPSNSLKDNNATVISKSQVHSGAPMVHNNMVPFFGGNSKQNTNIDNRLMADKLDIFTGNFRLNQQHKQEVKTLFSPAPQNIINSAAPRPLDMFAKSCTVRNGEKPFEQIRVAPGLNNGYTDKGSEGFHPTLRIMPLSSEQEQVNPKTTFEGVVKAGGDQVGAGATRPNLYHYRQHVLVDNENGQRNFTTTGEVVAPMVYSDIILKDTNQKNVVFMTQPAKDQSAEKHLPCEMQPENKISTRDNFENTPFRSAIAKEGLKIPENRDSYKPLHDNERLVSQEEYSKSGREHGNVNTLPHNKQYNMTPAKETLKQHLIDNKLGYYNNTAGGAPAIYTDDAPETTLKELIEDNNHIGNVKLNDGGISYDPTMKARTTLKEVTEHNDYVGTLSTSTKGKVLDSSMKSRTTLKEIIEVNDYNGTLSTSTKGKVLDPAMKARTTLKEVTEVNDYVGTLSGAMKGKVLDPSTKSRTTLKEITELNDYNGTLSGAMKGKVLDPSTKARTTLKEITELNDHNGTLSGAMKGKVLDPSTKARTTLKEIIEVNDHNGILSSATKGKVLDPTTKARTTLKEIIEVNDHNGILSGAMKGKVLDPATKSRTTLKELTEINNNNGTLSGAMKGKVLDPSTKARTTIKETTEENDYKVVSITAPKHITYDPYDTPKLTQRNDTENTEYIGIVNSSTYQNGGGYETAPTDVNNTQRESYSDYYYVKSAGPAEGQRAERIYTDTYNMRQNTNAEIIAQGREPTKVCAPLASGKDIVNLDVKKLDSDRENKYGFVKSAIITESRKPISQCEVTKNRNDLPSHNSRWDPYLLDAFNRNPLTQSLHSWA